MLYYIIILINDHNKISDLNVWGNKFIIFDFTSSVITVI